MKWVSSDDQQSMERKRGTLLKWGKINLPVLEAAEIFVKRASCFLSLESQCSVLACLPSMFCIPPMFQCARILGMDCIDFFPMLDLLFTVSPVVLYWSCLSVATWRKVHGGRLFILVACICENFFILMLKWYFSWGTPVFLPGKFHGERT